MATVSRCINTPDLVQPETREKVAQAMEALSYRYNSLARSFVTQRSKTLGVIVPTITNPVFAESLRGIQDYATPLGYHVIIGNTDYNGDKEEHLLRNLRERQVEGIVLTSSDLSNKALEEIRKEQFPCVLLYSRITSGPLSAVGVDNIVGGRMATSFLLQQGHTRIAMLAGDFALSDRSLHRFQGYRDVLENEGPGFAPELVVQTTFSLAECRQAVTKIMAARPAPTALFCSNDLLAVGAMAGLKALGLRTPADVSVVGFDDTSMSAHVSPALTTVRQPLYDMGLRSAALLIDMLEGNLKTPVYELLPLRMIVRESVAPKTLQP